MRNVTRIFFVALRHFIIANKNSYCKAGKNQIVEQIRYSLSKRGIFECKGTKNMAESINLRE